MHEAVVTRTCIKLRNSFLFRFRRWKEFLSFIPWVSHAVMIKKQSRNRCGTGSVQKKPESQDFRQNFPTTHTNYNSAVNFSIIGQSRHEKDLVLCLMRILARCVEVLR